MEHELKSDPALFRDIWNKMVDFSIRNNDRKFKVGDTVVFRETLHSHEIMKIIKAPPVYTGFKVIATINFVSNAPSASAVVGERHVVICFKINKWIIDYRSIDRSIIDGKKRLIRKKERKHNRTIEI